MGVKMGYNGLSDPLFILEEIEKMQCTSSKDAAVLFLLLHKVIFF